MSELASIEKLREWLHDDAYEHPELMAIVDEIQRGVSERYIELPVDKNGEPWTLDTEEFLDDTGNMLCFSGLRVNIKGEWLVQSNCTWLDPHDCLRIRSRTIEDVLCDMIHEYGSTDALTETIAAKYAAELRGMMEADDD